ncbi:hypothetical protein QBC39DRAFT_379637 [Podospora conica]|nr:hypothetical protein QBC39DRAFT_379637 [Schizothecium conicum]
MALWSRVLSGSQVFYDRYRYSGLEALAAHNPIPLLGIVPHRVVSRDVDQVCGIMQVFGFKLDRALGLPKLAKQFRQQLLRTCPVLSQAFVRLRRLGSTETSWCVPQFTEDDFGIGRPAQSKRVQPTVPHVAGTRRRNFVLTRTPQAPFDYTKMVPQDFYNMEEVESSIPTRFTFHPDASLEFTGLVIEMSDMERLIKGSEPALRAAPPNSSGNLSDDEMDAEMDAGCYQYTYGKYTNSPHCSVHLDVGPCDGSNPFNPKPRDPLNQHETDPVTEVYRLASKIGGSMVLVMGKFRVSRKEAYLGVIVAELDGKYRRVGFCTWTQPPGVYREDKTMIF